jgi:hypothetical protein
MSYSNLSFSQDYPVPDPQTSFYISPIGNDILGNGTRELPFRTFTKAYSRLAAWRVANGGSTAHGYLIALDGVYDYSNQGVPQNVNTSSSEVGLMSPEVLQNVTMMADRPLGANINYLVKTTATGQVFNSGQSNEYREYVVDNNTTGVTFTVNRARSSVGLSTGGTINVPTHLFYGSYKYILGPQGTSTPNDQISWIIDDRNPVETTVVVSDPTTLPSLSSNTTIGYPAIYKYAPPTDEAELALWEEQNWTANVRQWSLRRDDNHQFALGLTYDFVYIPELGVTGAWVRQRDDLLPGPNGNTYWLENTSNPPVFFKDILQEIELLHPGISWSDNVIGFVGGNSNVHLTRIVQVDSANGRVLVEKPATWFDSSRYWLGTAYAENDGTGQPTNTVGFINRRFIERPGQYAFEKGGKLYLKNYDGNSNLPRVKSNKTIVYPFLLSNAGSMVQGNPEGSNDTNFTKNVVIAGFAMSGCDSAVSIRTSGTVGNNTEKAPTNVKITCNLVHDTLNGPGIGISNGFGKIEVSNNFILRGDDRALYTNRKINKHIYWKLDEPTLFYNNVCYNWRRGAGIMMQGCNGVRTIGNKLYAVGEVAHGDGMAVYSFSNDVEVRDNYLYTPNLIGLAVNEIYRGADAVPPRFINNIIFGGVVFRDSDSTSGSIWENNTFGINNQDGHPRVFRVPTSTNTDPWWNTTKHKFRNNVILSTTDWMAMQGSTQNDGNSYNVFLSNEFWTLPTEFNSVANNLRGPSGPWHTYFSHKHIAGDGLPNWHNNIAPNVYQFDRITGAQGVEIGIKYPYAETNTFIVNNNPLFRPRFTSAYSTWPGDAGIPGTFTAAEGLALYQQARIDQIYSKLFVDYVNGNLNIKQGATAYDGTVIPAGVGTSIPYTLPPTTTDITDQEFEDRLSEFWGAASSSGVIANPPPIPNHPITINLSTTDLTENVTWMTKNGFDGHSGDGIYPDDNILKIPNIMGGISTFANPGLDPEIGPSTQDEIDGSSGGGVFIISEQDANRNYTLQETGIGSRNDLNVTTQVKDFMQLGKANAGQTMSLIMHGQCDPSVEHGEFKTIYGNDTEGVLDEFYKSNSYIAFNSKDNLTQETTNTAISFRKHPHHLYVSADAPSLDFSLIRDFRQTSTSGNTATIFLNHFSTRTVPMNNFISTLVSLSATSGVTLTVNEYTGEITTASRSLQSDLTIPNIVSCTSQSYSFSYDSSFFGSFILSTTLNPSALFTGTFNKLPYYHTGNPSKTTLCGGPEPAATGKFKINLDQKMALRLKVPANVGTKNLLALKVKSTATTRLFGGSNSVGIAAGSYIRISGSSSNDGIYKVLSVQDGIDSDTPSNTKFGATNGTEYQYLELSRDITPENHDEARPITVEDVSHLPILHIKYKTLENP